jgi:pectate lyase
MADYPSPENFMNTTLISTRTLLLLAVAASIATGCSSSGPSTSHPDAGGAGGSSAGTGGSSAGTGGSSAGAGGSSTGGTVGNDGGAGNAPFVYFVKQANGTTTATLAGGTFSVNSAYSTSGNGFKYVQPNNYGTVSNGFISFPTPMTGDFSIMAQVNITTENKANNACGIGVGLTTGWTGTDSFAYTLMRNSNNSTNGYFVNGAGTMSTGGGPMVAFTTGTALQLTFSRTGTNVTFGAGPVGGTSTTTTVATSALTNGTTVYGGGAVYPTISFNNVAATITNLVIKDASGATVYDSATGGLVTYVPASLSLSSTTVNLAKGASGSVTATAIAIGGAVSGVTAVSSDPTVATATVTDGATNSTIALDGLKGGVSMVTVTNTGDTNTATNTKTILVSVAEYEATDPYGSLATRAYPAPGATNAYTDGELALTFDAPPTLNTGGLINIYALADGSAVDSIAFAGETQTFGTTVINVGSQLARVSGNTVFFTPHLGKLAYGTAYYVAISTTSISGTLTGVAFNGLSNLATVATWKFTTRAAPTLSAASVTVDGGQSSTAHFRTLQGALGGLAAGLPAATAVTINMAAGTYNELVHYTGPGATQTITILGPAGNNRGDNCIVQYSNGNMINGSTSTRAAVYITGTNLVLQNITLKNTGVRSVVSQAEALYFAGGSAFTLAAFNSSFYSNQDTIQTSGRNWFYNCYVEGNVDFIWGTADAALFESCSLRFINDLAGAAANYGLFVARTGATIAAGAGGTVPKGYVLLNSTVSVDANVTATFGRDAGTGAFYDQAAVINVVFSGAGMLGAGIWNIGTAPLSLGDSSYVGWKSAGCSGLNLAALTTDPKTSATIASQATEYDTRDHILNRVVTVTAGVPSGYTAAATSWDVSSLATAWAAP